MKRSVVTHFEVYKSADGWRWHARRSGRIVAESGEAYKSKRNLTQSLLRFIDSLADFDWNCNVGLS